MKIGEHVGLASGAGRTGGLSSGPKTDSTEQDSSVTASTAATEQGAAWVGTPFGSNPDHDAGAAAGVNGDQMVQGLNQTYQTAV